jgi:tetratricopeptide (TPR) repeat protein
VLEKLLLHSARHKPLVLVLEDLHWADPFALGFAEHLVSSLTQQAEDRLLSGQKLPLLCICTVRRRYVRERAELSRAVQNMERQLGRGFARLELERMDLVASAKLLGDILPLDNPVLERILRLTQGNPLHLIQQVRYLATGQMLELGAGDRWRLTPGSSEAWPVDLKSLLHSRIEQSLRAGAEAHNTSEITRLLCVLGSRFGRDLLETFLACLGRADLLPHINSALGSLIRSGVMEHEPGQAQRYVFAHVLFYEVLSEQLHTDPSAPSYHHAAALAKERLLHHNGHGDRISMGWHADVARHWEAAGAHDKAVEHRLEAARAAERGLDLESARALYRMVEQALAAEDVISPLRISAQLSLGTLHLRLGELGPAEDILRRASQLARSMGDMRSEGRSLNVLGRLHTVRSGHKEALRAFRRAASCFKRLGSEDPVDVALWAEAQLGQAEVARLRGELQAAETLFREALERAREARARAVEGRCLYGLGKIAHVYGRLRDALSFLQGAHDLFEQCELGVESASVSCDLGLSQLFTHGRAVSESTIRRALEVVDNAGERLQSGYARLQLGLAMRRSPRLEEARAFGEEAHRIFTRLDNTYGQGKAILLLGELDFLESNLPAARQRGQAALTLHEQINDAHGVAMSLMFLGIWELESGHSDQAHAHLNLALNMYNNSGILVYQPLCMLHLGRLFEQRGQLNQAYKHYLQAQHSARQADNREALAVSMACLGGLSLVQGRLGQARGYFQNCLEVSQELDHVDMQGLALFGNAWIETLSGNVSQRKRHLRDLAQLMRICAGRDFYFRERLVGLSEAVSRTRGAQEAAHYRATALEVIQQISAADA